jgi:hypothetical protein
MRSWFEWMGRAQFRVRRERASPGQGEALMSASELHPADKRRAFPAKSWAAPEQGLSKAVCLPDQSRGIDGAGASLGDRSAGGRSGDDAGGQAGRAEGESVVAPAGLGRAAG